MTDGLRMSHPVMDPYTIEPTDQPPPSFIEHLQALPEHESVILQHFELLAGEVETMCALISQMEEVLLVSDGGAAEDYGSYGWVLGLTNGTRLAQGWGKVYGHIVPKVLEPRQAPYFCGKSFSLLQSTTTSLW